MVALEDRITRLRANVEEAIDTGRVGLLDGDTGEWIDSPVATLTVSAATVPCAPDESVYVLVSDLSPDVPIQYCVDKAEPGTVGKPLARLLELSAILTDVGGLLGLCRACCEPVVLDEGVSLCTGLTDAPSRRHVIHIDCAGDAARQITGL
jgi:hypothetical protein